MAFVTEHIPSDVLDSFDFSIFKEMFERHLPSKLRPTANWTRDKDRDAFLLWTGGGGGPHVDAPRQDMFALWWKSDIVYFIGEPVDSRDSDCQVLTWKNVRLGIPDHLKPRRDEFVALLKEALIAEGTKINTVVPENSTKVFVNLA